MTARGVQFATESGPVWCARLHGVEVHHVGYAPTPWDWADWAYAKSGRFQGRWDDPEGHWRAKYVGESALGCFLEVLAPFRPDPRLVTDMDDIDDDEEYPTVAAGRLDTSWCTPRMSCAARLIGDFAVPSHSKTLPTLRERFLLVAVAFGVRDVDAAAMRLSAPRELTQSVSAWIYELVGAEGERINGIEYASRHGDDITLWAIYERGGSDSPPELVDRAAPRAVTSSHPALRAAMRIHRIKWART